MPDPISDRHGLRVFTPGADGIRLDTDRDATDLVGEALHHRADLVVVPVGCFDDGFFTLGTGIAGQIIQKFVNYRLRLAIVGDISRHLEQSSALRDFVYESNRGRQVWFVADLPELDARLERAQRQRPGA